MLWFPIRFSFLLPGRWQLSAYSQVQLLWIFSCLKQQIKYFSIGKQIYLGRASSSASFQARQRDHLSELLNCRPQMMLQARHQLGLGKLQADFRSLYTNVMKTTYTWWENNAQCISESSRHRIREWFGWEETLQIILLQTICKDTQPIVNLFREVKTPKFWGWELENQAAISLLAISQPAIRVHCRAPCRAVR